MICAYIGGGGIFMEHSWGIYLLALNIGVLVHWVGPVMSARPPLNVMSARPQVREFGDKMDVVRWTATSSITRLHSVTACRRLQTAHSEVALAPRNAPVAILACYSSRRTLAH